MSSVRGRILVVDDEPNIRRLLSGVLQDEGYQAKTAQDAQALREALDQDETFDLVLLDVCLPRESGLDLLRDGALAEHLPPVIMMSGHGTIDTALEAVRAGAYDFLEKPIAVERLLLSIHNCLEARQLRVENRDLREGAGRELLGTSEAMLALRAAIERAAPSDARVLITGENGTGKELVARALHRLSPRRGRPFIKVNCAAIPSELLESELFGHEKGAFTGAIATRRGKFELAQRGTLLLDEIGDMNPTTQAKLLRVLEENELERVGGERPIPLDVRVLASTNRNLPALIEATDFREDLYFRLQVIPLHVPPLREHAADVPLLCEHYLRRFADETGRGEKQISDGALRRLAAHAWPGNVRELRNLMERLVVMIDDPVVTERHLQGLLDAQPRQDDDGGGTLAARLEAFERQAIGRAVEAAGGNLAEAARQLGVDRANLHRRMRRLGLTR
jgi:two-component system nitrogen regulation response regulator NtrX